MEADPMQFTLAQRSDTHDRCAHDDVRASAAAAARAAAATSGASPEEVAATGERAEPGLMEWMLARLSNTHDRCAHDDVRASAAAAAARAAAAASGASPEEVAAAGERARLAHLEMSAEIAAEDARALAEIYASTKELAEDLIAQAAQCSPPDEITRWLTAELEGSTAGAARSHALTLVTEQEAARARAAAAGASRRVPARSRLSTGRAQCIAVARSQSRCHQRSRRTRRRPPRASSASDDGSGEPPRHPARLARTGGRP
jgi:hypothetical protein